MAPELQRCRGRLRLFRRSPSVHAEVGAACFAESSSLKGRRCWGAARTEARVGLGPADEPRFQLASRLAPELQHRRRRLRLFRRSRRGAQRKRRPLLLWVGFGDEDYVLSEQKRPDSRTEGLHDSRERAVRSTRGPSKQHRRADTTSSSAPKRASEKSKTTPTVLQLRSQQLANGK